MREGGCSLDVKVDQRVADQGAETQDGVEVHGYRKQAVNIKASGWWGTSEALQTVVNIVSKQETNRDLDQLQNYYYPGFVGRIQLLGGALSRDTYVLIQGV